MSGITFSHIYKTYQGNVTAVNDFNLEIKDKEFVVLVGPSGCGKSTTLRMIAGLEEISKGELYIGDRLVNEVAPKDRDIAMVFQNYALYPHMSVYDNMAFGLKLRKFSKQEIKERVEQAANILDITDYLNRRPKALSGGQRQRVALGRAIVREPQVFLMDEPLSNLDAKLRVQMRGEITKLHRRLQTTFVYVTHDQTEAMTMADRIVIMKDGFIQQIGTPKEVYDQPNNVFVGGFVGSPAMNFFNGRLEEDKFVFADKKVTIPNEKMSMIKDKVSTGQELILGIRPEHIHDASEFIEANHDYTLESQIEVAELMGAETFLNCKIQDQEFVARIDSRTDVQGGQTINLAFDMTNVHFFDVQTEESISK